MDRLIVLFKPQLDRGDIKDAGNLHGPDPRHDLYSPHRLLLPPNSQLLLLVVGLPHGVPEELDVLAALPVLPGGRHVVPCPVVDVAGLFDVPGDLKDPWEVGGEVPTHQVNLQPEACSKVTFLWTFSNNRNIYFNPKIMHCEEQGSIWV